ncbi:hypothetical protein N7530_012833 [Penicillium desertorum]|uniref:Uncharacterized protein n=1 Tax=Penicillium desertorum TaxID=1303715 RepID=A0A9X0BFL9_9EURO|nr:hypothetical protein N7530_012833 [Penicillium desertorum]
MSLSFSKKWPTLYGDFVVHGPPPYKNCPPQQFLATSTAFWVFTPQTGSSRGGGFTHRSGVIRDPATPDPPHDLLPAQCLGSPRGPLGARPGCYGGALAELLPGASAAVTEARGLSAPGTVGVCGSMAAGHTRNPDSWREPPRGIRRSPALSTGSGPFIRGPHAAACQRLHGRLVGSPACGLALEEFSGGNRTVSASPPVRRGCRRNRAPRAPLPFNYILPPRGSGTRLKTPGRLAMKLPG